MKRKDALTAIKVAAYHNDQRTSLRIYTEHRLSFAAYQEAWSIGLQQKKSGMPCGCHQCKTAQIPNKDTVRITDS